MLDNGRCIKKKKQILLYWIYYTHSVNMNKNITEAI